MTELMVLVLLRVHLELISNFLALHYLSHIVSTDVA